MHFAVAAIPRISKIAEPGHHRLGKVICEPTVQSDAESKRAETVQRNVVTRQVNPLEAVPFLEITKAILLFFPVREVGIYKMSDLSFGTGTDRVGNQSIRYRFITMLHHRDNVHQSRLDHALIGCQL